MTRRMFAHSLAAATAAAQTPPPPAPPKAKITSSVMLWTLQGSFEEKVAAAARAGLQSVELWSDADVARVKRH